MTRRPLFQRWEALREESGRMGREREGWQSSARALSATLSRSSCPGVPGDGGDEAVRNKDCDDVTVGRRKNGGRYWVQVQYLSRKTPDDKPRVSLLGAVG